MATGRIHTLRSAFAVLKSLSNGRRKRRHAPAPQSTRARPGVELLEDRITPTTFIVNVADDNTTDDGNLTLREAILAANGAPANDDHLTNGGAPEADGDRIEFNLAANSTIVLTNELPTITDDVVIDGSAVAGLTVTGDVGNNDIATDNVRVFDIDTAGNEAVVINGLIITEGNTANSDGDDGGAVRIADGENVTLSDVTISQSIAAMRGGAVFAGNGMLTVTNATIGGMGVGNTALGTDADDGGGGIYVLGGTAVISGSSITANEALNGSGSGGGILLNGGSLTVTGGTISANSSARAGGGIEVRSTVTSATVSIVSVNVTNNVTGNNPGNGGGLHVTTPGTVGTISATVTVAGGQFANNTAGNEGGGLWNDIQGSLTITDVTISGNTAAGNPADSGGGGVFSQGGTLTIISSSITSNTATGTSGSGGGVLLDGGTLIINGTTLSGNTAVRAGGGIEATAQNRDFTAMLTSVTITGNSTGNTPGNGGGIHVSDNSGGTGTGTFAITGGTIAGNVANQEGGGVWNDAESTMTIDGTLLTGNTANAANAGGDAQGGGGAFNNGGTLTISNATITGNIAAGSLGTDDGGGGVFNDSRNSPGTVTITNTTISGNTAATASGNGGGILNLGDSDTIATVNVTGGSISNNSVARAGGAVENNVGVVTFTGVTLDGNSAGINGGAIHVSGAGTVTATNSTFSGNSAGNEGGGLWNSSAATASITLNASTVHNNSATFGGGLFNDGAAGTITLVNSTVSTNSASQDGGGIDSEGGTVDLDNSTIVGNSAGANGGGLHIDAGTTTTVDNTIIANNSAPNGPDVSGTITANFSLIENTAGATISGANNLIGIDPDLGPLADNGGPTLTHIPQGGSPVLNAGDPNFTTPPDTDQRGLPRVQAGRLDIGSVEGAAGLAVGSILAVGSDAGPVGQVNVFDPATGQVRFAFVPFAGYTGGLRVGVGDVNNDGTADVIVGAGPGAPGGHVKVFDGGDGTEIRSFFSFVGFTGGVFVAGGDVDGDGFADIIVGADAGATPHVKVFSGQTGEELASFFAFGPTFGGGVRVAAGDVSGDGLADIIIGAGAGATGGHVKVVNAAQRTNVQSDGQIADAALLASFFAYVGFPGGIFVGSGDVNGDGLADVLTGAGTGGPTHVKAFSGADFSTLASFITADPQFNQGVRVTATDRDGDGRADIVSGSGSPASPATLRFFDGLSQQQLDSFFAFDPPFNGGIFVAGI